MVWAKIRNKKKDMHGKIIRFMVDNFRQIRIGDMGAKFIMQNKMMNKGQNFNNRSSQHTSFVRDFLNIRLREP